jgi:cyclopropane fatty-acyl-phospholipid synthase-like methyltransferase
MQKIICILRDILPDGIRHLPFLQRIKNFLNHKIMGHDGVYNQQYYQNTVETPAVQSATVICNSIIARFKPKNLIDVGCGTGALMEAFQNNGVKASGLEYSDAALAFCRQRNLDVTKFNLETNNFENEEYYDVAVSMEVAEHLPKKIADQYVGLLAKLSNVVVFTAATPGQGGQDHVNEQPPAYWIKKFAGQGFCHDSNQTEAWKKEWQSSGSVTKWYYDNLLVFVKGI